MPHKPEESYLAGRVGLDIGSHAIKGVEVVERDQELVVRAVGSYTLSHARDPGAALDHGAWLPADRVHIKWLNLEAAGREELDMTARTAAVRGAPFPSDEAIVDYRILSSRGTVSRNIMLEIQRRGAGNLWRGQPLAHIIVGARNTTISVLRAGELEFARTVPVGGDIVNKIVISRAMATMSTLLACGIPMVKALETSAAAANNEVIKEALFKARTDVAEGNATSQALRVSDLFPPLVLQMFASGEKTGELPMMPEYVCALYGRETDAKGEVFDFGD